MPAKTLAWIATALLCLWALHANVSPDFTPVRSELGNARGFSRGVLNLVVLPADAPFSRAPGWGLIVCAAAFVLLGARRPVRSTHESKPRLRRAVVIAGGAAAVIVAAAVASPYLTAFRIVLAPRTFVLCVTLILGARAFASRAADGCLAGRRSLMAQSPPAFVASAMLQTLAAYDGNYSGFLHIARDVAAASVHSGAARDRPLADRLRRRLRRAVHVPDRLRSAAAPLRRSAAGVSRIHRQPAVSLRTDRVQSAHPARCIRRTGAISGRDDVADRGRASGAGDAAWPGLRRGTDCRRGRASRTCSIPAFMSSLMSALPEALAAAALVGGYVNWEPRRPWLAMLWFGAALLIRETGVVLILALVLAGGTQEWKRSIAMVMASLLPVAVWRLFVATRLYADFGWAAIVTNPGDLGVPLDGPVAPVAGGRRRNAARAGNHGRDRVSGPSARCPRACGDDADPWREHRDAGAGDGGDTVCGCRGLTQLRQDLEPPAQRRTRHVRAVSLSAVADVAERSAAGVGTARAAHVSLSRSAPTRS